MKMDNQSEDTLETFKNYSAQILKYEMKWNIILRLFSSIPAGSSIQVGALNFLIPFLIYPFAFGNYFVRWNDMF